MERSPSAGPMSFEDCEVKVFRSRWRPWEMGPWDCGRPSTRSCLRQTISDAETTGHNLNC